MRRVRFSRRAKLDLHDIGDWISRDRPMAARRFVEALIARTTALPDMPEMGPLYPAYGDGVRGLTLKPYVILYRVTEVDILIERIVHGARLPKSVK